MRDVTVLGASTSGLYAAVGLARAGMRVQVVEQAADLRPVPRSLVVTSAFRCSVPSDLQGCVTAEVHRYELYAAGRMVSVELAKPDLVVERSRLLADLAGAAEDAGVRLSLASRSVAVRAAAGGVALDLRHPDGASTVESPVLVAADGANSGVRRALGWARQPTVTVLQAIVERPPELPAGTARVWFRPSDTPFFYWLLPRSATTAAVGLVARQDGSPRRLLDTFLQEHRLYRLRYEGALIPRYDRWLPPRQRLGQAQVHFVGDAAGHVKLSTVGGLVTGFTGADAAVRAVQRRPHRSELRGLRRELAVHRMLHHTLARFDDHAYRRLFDVLDERVCRTLGRLSRDDAASLLLQLLARRPSLISLALRSRPRDDRTGAAAPAWSDTHLAGRPEPADLGDAC